MSKIEKPIMETESLKDIINEHWDDFLKEYFLQKCKGCKDGHSSFWRTVIMSEQWKRWRKYAWEDNQLYDFSEVEECGIISEKHWNDFINFLTD